MVSIDFLQNKYKIVEDEFKNISTTLKSPDWKEAPEFKIEGSSSDAQIQRFVELYSSIRMIFYTSLKLIYILFSNIYKEYHDKYGMPIAEYTSVDNLKKYDEAIQRMEIKQTKAAAKQQQQPKQKQSKAKADKEFV